MKIKLDCVMLVDDDEEDNYYHKLILEESFSIGLIKIAESGFEALNYLGAGELTPDIIFLDANMPKMNGWEFVEQYKKIASAQQKQPVIIMLTTSLSPIDKEKAQKVPEINGFETKPLTDESFDKILDRYFSKK